MRSPAAWKWITCACISVSLLRGQAFQHLAATEDGSVLYFSSPVRQRGTEQSLHSKIFRWDDAGGFRVVAEQRERGEFDGRNYANFYELTAPSVTYDGGIFAYTASRPVQSSRFCSGIDPSRGTVMGARRISLDGIAAVARSGRYAVAATPTSTASRYHFVTDLGSGMTTVVAGTFDGSWDRITDEGAVIVPETMALLLAERSGVTRAYRTEYPVSDVIVDRSGRTAVYVTPFRPAGSGRITRVDLASGRETTIFTGFAPSTPVITSDGSTIFFIDSNRLYAAASGGEPRLITNQVEAIVSATASGNGRIAYAVTSDSRLLRIEVSSGAVTELAPATPVISDTYRVYRPRTTDAAVGSLMQFFGSGLDAVRSVDLCGRAVPMIRNGQFQVPWDLPEGACLATVRTDSPFEHTVELNVLQYSPAFASQVLHERFNGPVTLNSPAAPGEVVVVYMSGLGPVNAGGELLRPGFQCRFDFVQAAVEHLALSQYAGFFQLNVRVPEVSGPSTSLTCGWGDGTEAAAPVPVAR